MSWYYDHSADVGFFCGCPVRSVNGLPIGDDTVPCPIIRRTTDAYIELVDCDFVTQSVWHPDSGVRRLRSE